MAITATKPVKTIKKATRNLVMMILSIEKRSSVFYILALIPLFLLSYSYAQTPFGLAIPLYGLVILILKKPKLFSRSEAGTLQKILGLVVIIASFFVGFLLSLFIPNAVFYGFANYSLYIIGLFLLFFEVSALKEAFSPLFLVVAFFMGSFISDVAQLFLISYLPTFTSFIASVLRIMGIDAAVSSLNTNRITFSGLKGPVMLDIVWGCIGFTSMFIFFSILIVIMFEDASSVRTKVIWSILGLLGTFFINTIRIITIYMGFYFYGSEWNEVHLYLGYILFISWSVIFFYLFSKRDVISQKMAMGHGRKQSKAKPALRTIKANLT